MKQCPNCGTQLPDEAKFCSSCGTAIEAAMPPVPPPIPPDTQSSRQAQPVQSTIPSPPAQKPSLRDKVKAKAGELWQRMSLYGKVVFVSIAVFVLLALFALLFGKTFALVIAAMQIILAIVSLLMKKGVIKTARSWIGILVLAAAFALIIPYGLLCTVGHSSSSPASSASEQSQILWADLALHDVLPEPESLLGQVLLDSDEALLVNISGVSKSQYSGYIEACESAGFTVESERSDSLFTAYNTDGYTLRLLFNDSDEEMEIHLEAPEEYGTLVWPDTALPAMLPIPQSTTGEVTQNDETAFQATVSQTSQKAYQEYITACAEVGFTVEPSNGDNSYSAENDEGYRLTLRYEGNSIMSVFLEEPEYELALTITCEENLLFSRYDVEVFLGDESLGTVPHGGSETFLKELPKGSYTLKFVNAEDDSVTGETALQVEEDSTLEFGISCTSTGIDVEQAGEEEKAPAESIDESSTGEAPPASSEGSDAEESVSDASQTEPSLSEPSVPAPTEAPPQVLTAENCPALAALLQLSDPQDPTVAEFASAYYGDTIEFDGCILNLMHHGTYDTRFDVLIGAGDYDPNSARGPQFHLTDVNFYAMNVTGGDSVYTGLNVRVTAEVGEYNSMSGLFELEIVSMEIR